MLVGVGVRHFQAEHFPVTKKSAAAVPPHAFCRNRRAGTDMVENFQAALGPADRSRADRNHIVVVEHNRGHAPLGKVDLKKNVTLNGSICAEEVDVDKDTIAVHHN